MTKTATESRKQGVSSKSKNAQRWSVPGWLRAAFALTPVALQTALLAERIWNWVPVWAWYPDPGYQYLLAGGQIITGGTPHHNDHPGTSAQWLIGLIEAPIHAAVGNDSLRSDLVQRPELYAQGVGVVIGLLFVLALAFSALRLLRSLGLGPSLAFQFLIIWGLPILDIGRYRIMPESVVLTAVIVSIGLLAPRLSDPKRPIPTVVVVTLGLVTAIGVTAKVLFAPMVLVAIAVLGRRQIALFSFTFFAAVATILIPIYSRFDYMRSWFTGILLNPGRQGQPGERPSLTNSIQESVNLLNLSVRWFLLVAFASMLIALAGVVLRGRSTGNWQWRGQGALVLAFALVMLASVKSAETRDFLLAFPLLGAINALGLHMILQSTSNRKVQLFISTAAILTTGFLGLHGAVGTHYNHQIQVARLQPLLQLQDQVKSRTQSGSWGLGYNVWTEQNAIMFALPWLNGAYDVEVNKRYPGALYFDIWSRVFIGTTGTGSLRILSCRDVESKAASDGINVIVETPNHLAFEPSGRSFSIRDGEAVARKESSIGSFGVYQLIQVECHQEVGNEP